MCGIAGFIAPQLTYCDRPLDLIAAGMADAIAHRGPDDSAVWTNEADRVALSHRRLSIIDLSPEGRQPMCSSDQRYVIVYNGEVYNFRQLRKQLMSQGLTFRGRSDTEVVLALIREQGVIGAIRQCIGMFAFALWDQQDKRLYLVRDRLGIKPLYYGWCDGNFLFGSELKALRAFPGFSAPVDRNALKALLRYNYVPTPLSIHGGVFKLPPGHVLTVDLPDMSQRLTPYWTGKQVVESGVRQPFHGSQRDAIEELDSLLRTAVGDRMIADVPLGAFLSGGYDSSTVVALMQQQSTTPVRTFSIGFHDRKYDESRHARAVAGHLGTEHTELCVTPEECMAVVPQLASLYDEPFSDSSQIPTFLVSKLARADVTVSLSGDGGDELFGGYNRHVWGQRIWNRVRWLPVPARRALARTISSVPAEAWNNGFQRISPLLADKLRIRLLGEKAHKLAEVLPVESPDALYLQLISQWKDPAALVLGADDTVNGASWHEAAELPDFTERMMYNDLVGYLPDDILTKLDRASMGVSLEARVPLLDHRVVEFAWQLPQSLKIRAGQGKWILREVLARYVPKRITERPKMGFAVPIDNWLRGPMRDWAEALLDESRLKTQGLLDPAPVRRVWHEHLTRRKNWHSCLWGVLMFQLWLDEQQPRRPTD